MPFAQLTINQLLMRFSKYFFYFETFRKLRKKCAQNQVWTHLNDMRLIN